MRALLAALILCWFGLALASAKDHKSSASKDNHGQEQQQSAKSMVLVIDSHANAPQAGNNSPDNKSETDAKIADYTGQLAKYTFWLAILTAIVAAVGVIQLYFLNISEKTNAKSAQAAAKAAEVAESTLAATTRPWISVEVFSDNGIEWINGQATLTLNLRLTNRGNSPAISVVPTVEMYPHPGHGSPFLDTEMMRICGEDWKRPDELGDAIFPNDYITTDFTVTISAAQIEAMNQFITGLFKGKSPSGNTIFPGIAGCIGYKFAFSKERHQTGFNYDISKKMLGPGNIRHGIDIGTNVPGHELLFSVGATRGSYAN
jgi:hypothetical protein